MYKATEGPKERLRALLCYSFVVFMLGEMFSRGLGDLRFTAVFL